MAAQRLGHLRAQLARAHRLGQEAEDVRAWLTRSIASSESGSSVSRIESTSGRLRLQLRGRGRRALPCPHPCRRRSPRSPPWRGSWPASCGASRASPWRLRASRRSSPLREALRWGSITSSEPAVRGDSAPVPRWSRAPARPPHRSGAPSSARRCPRASSRSGRSRPG